MLDSYDLIEILKNRGDVLIRNEKALAEKLHIIKQDGHRHLQVVSDFDGTLTPADKLAVFQITKRQPKLDRHFSDKTCKLAAECKPKENDMTLTEEQRAPYIKKWIRDDIAYMAAADMIMDTLSSDVLTEKHMNEFVLRDGAEAFLRRCRYYEIPVVILSAGLAEAIHELLDVMLILRDNLLHVLANETLLVRKQINGLFCNVFGGVKNAENIIDGTTKSDILAEYLNDCELRQPRKNFIVLGDMPHDVKVLDKSDAETVLLVGFQKDSTKAADYLKLYDIVITGDATFDCVNAMMTYLFQYNPRPRVPHGQNMITLNKLLEYQRRQL